MKRYLLLIICAFLCIGLLGCATAEVAEVPSSVVPSGSIPPASAPPASVPVYKPYIVYSPYAINQYTLKNLGDEYSLYCKLVDSVLQYNPSVSGFESEHQFHKLWCIMREEFPPAQMLCANFKNTDTPYAYADGTVKLQFLHQKDGHMRILKTYAQCIQNDLSLLTEEDTEMEKIAKIYKRVSEVMRYEKSSMELYDCIVKKQGVCDKYARYMMILLNQLNVECYYAYSDGEGVVNHAWVVAKMNDQFYHFDPTWEQSFENWFWFAIDDKLRKDSLVTEWQTVYGMGGNLDAINGDHVQIGSLNFILTSQKIPLPVCPEAYKGTDIKYGMDPWLW